MASQQTEHETIVIGTLFPGQSNTLKFIRRTRYPSHKRARNSGEGESKSVCEGGSDGCYFWMTFTSGSPGLKTRPYGVAPSAGNSSMVSLSQLILSVD